MNAVIAEVLVELKASEDEIANAAKAVQRNQNQSAVGGNDLSNTFGLSIEVKRQEALSIGTWWKQCVLAAERNKELPVLIFKQNRKPWRIRTYGWLPHSNGEGGWTYSKHIVEFDEPAFKEWFRAWVKGKILEGERVRC